MPYNRREDQRRMQDAARQKELDMLEAISDAETTRQLREEERKRREEEEWALQAKLAVSVLFRSVKMGCCPPAAFHCTLPLCATYKFVCTNIFISLIKD